MLYRKLAMKTLEALIDVERFVEQNGSIDLLGRLLPRFVAQATPWLQAFDQAIERNDTRTLRLLLHSMKGSCSVLYATQLVQALQHIETHLCSDNTSVPRTELREMGRQVRQFTQVLAAYLDDTARARP